MSSACHWVGTSMGGAIGMAAPAAGPLRGAHPPPRAQRHRTADAPAAFERIRGYAGRPPAFATVTELEQYFRTIYKPFGSLSDAQWRRLTETSTRRLPNGRVTPHYDPAIVMQFMHHPRRFRSCGTPGTRSTLPVLCLRGESSDLLLPETAAAMRVRGPRARVIEVPAAAMRRRSIRRNTTRWSSGSSSRPADPPQPTPSLGRRRCRRWSERPGSAERPPTRSGSLNDDPDRQAALR